MLTIVQKTQREALLSSQTPEDPRAQCSDDSPRKFLYGWLPPLYSSGSPGEGGVLLGDCMARNGCTPSIQVAFYTQPKVIKIAT